MSKTVEVRTKSITPKPIKEKEKELKKDGFLKWNLKLKPGEERVIQVLYEVVHPRGIQLEEWH